MLLQDDDDDDDDDEKKMVVVMANNDGKKRKTKEKEKERERETHKIPQLEIIDRPHQTTASFFLSLNLTLCLLESQNEDVMKTACW